MNLLAREPWPVPDAPPDRPVNGRPMVRQGRRLGSEYGPGNGGRIVGMTIRRTVTKRVEDDHCTLTCIISVMVLGMMAGVVELTADPVGSVATNVPMANGVRQSTLTVCGQGVGLRR